MDDKPADDKPKPEKPGEPSPLMTQLPALAAVAMILGQLTWAYLVYHQFSQGQGPFAGLNLVVTAVVLALAFGVWKRIPRAFGPGLVTCWYVLIITLIWIFRYELHVLWFGAGTMLVAVVAITKAREGLPGAKPAQPSPPEGESFAQWARENVEAIVVAFIMALVIRCFCIEVFKIPSSSMEPTLLGDVNQKHRVGGGGCEFRWEHWPDGSKLTEPDTPRASGDRIMVTKYYYAFNPVERYDVVVFKFPLNQAKNFIKRVVGLPGESLYMYRGDLFTNGGDEGLSKKQFTVARRPDRIQESVWIDVRGGTGRTFLSEEGIFEESWQAMPLTDPLLFAQHVVDSGELSTQENKNIRDILYRYNGTVTMNSSGVTDLRLAFDFELTSPKGEIFARIRNDYGTFTLHLSTEGDSRFIRRGPKTDTTTPLGETRLEPDRTYRLELAIHDGKAYARLDRETLHAFTLFTTRKERDAYTRPEEGQRVEFGARGTTFTVRNLSLRRDIHYQRSNSSNSLEEDEIVEIKPKHYVMMGDNVEHSHDSRAWMQQEFKLENGHRFLAEGQNIKESWENETKDAMERFGLDVRPDYFITEDQRGNQWVLYKPRNTPLSLPANSPFVAMLAEERDAEREAAPLVHEKFIVGKAFWIWWPPGRWFDLIK